MTEHVTILAPIKLAAGKTEADLIAVSNRFQREFADNQPGFIRRELLRKGDGEYLDIIQFRSREDAEAVVEKEKTSQVCRDFFAVMDMSASVTIDQCASLATYDGLQVGVEIARFRLRTGVSEADLQLAYGRMEQRFLVQQAGYVSHRLVKLPDGVYVDVTFAADQQVAERICASWIGQPDCDSFLALIEPESIEFGATV